MLADPVDQPACKTCHWWNRSVVVTEQPAALCLDLRPASWEGICVLESLSYLKKYFVQWAERCGKVLAMQA